MLVFETEMDKKDGLPNSSLKSFVDSLQAGGRYTFARAEVAQNSATTSLAPEAALRRLKKKGRIAELRRGFFVVVPLEYREAGCPPASWFIQSLMDFLGRPYYVGLLSAAAIHGAAHQQPMVFQVITDRVIRPVRAGRVAIQFHQTRNIEKLPVMEVQTETGTMRVSTPETTALDLVRFAAAAGHIGHVATVLAELLEKLDPGKLAELADSYPVPDVQRIGYLLEELSRPDLTGPLFGWLAKRRYRPIPLVHGKDAVGVTTESRWRVLPNESLELDL
jgi:predicted transcriptional regulator of viral defense system